MYMMMLRKDAPQERPLIEWLPAAGFPLGLLCQETLSRKKCKDAPACCALSTTKSDGPWLGISGPDAKPGEWGLQNCSCHHSCIWSTVKSDGLWLGISGPGTKPGEGARKTFHITAPGVVNWSDLEMVLDKVGVHGAHFLTKVKSNLCLDCGLPRV